MSSPIEATPGFLHRSGNGIFLVVVVLAIVAGAMVRMADLGRRPVHTDEAVNAFQTAEVLAGNGFRYDPKDYHGPLFIGLNAFTARLSGATDVASLSERTLRLGAVVSSLLGLLLVIPYSRLAGKVSAGVVALCLALDPIFVYYGRYAIHEALFVSLTFGFLLAIHVAWRTNITRWWAVAGALAGLMLSTKETAIIAFLAAAVAGWVCLPRLRTSRGLQGGLTFIAVAIVTTLFCYTWAFQDWGAVADLATAGPGYLRRAGGEGHEKPFFYYARLLLGTKSGALLFLLALIGCVIAWRETVRLEFIRFASLYTLLLLLIYSIIPYKTPWLALNLWLPMLLLAAAGFSRCLKRSTTAGFVIGAMVFAVMLSDLHARVFKWGWDERNPLAYSHPTDDILELPLRINRLAGPMQRPLRIGVVAADPWPIPWYLRHEQFVGYWPENAARPDLDVLILDRLTAERLQLESLGWRSWIFSQRPGSLLIMYWRPDTETR